MQDLVRRKPPFWPVTYCIMEEVIHKWQLFEVAREIKEMRYLHNCVNHWLWMILMQKICNLINILNLFTVYLAELCHYHVLQLRFEPPKKNWVDDTYFEYYWTNTHFKAWAIYVCPLCPIHVVTFTLISNLATDYIQKRRGEPGLFSFEYNLLPNLISK